MIFFCIISIFRLMFSWSQSTRRHTLPFVLILHTKRRNTRNPPPRSAGPTRNLHLNNVKPRLLHAKKLSSPNSRLKSRHKLTLLANFKLQFCNHVLITHKYTHTYLINVFFILSQHLVIYSSYIYENNHLQCVY